MFGLLKKSIQNQAEFFCPNCMTKHKDIKSEDNILALIKNYNLLRIAEKLENRKTIRKNTSTKHIKDPDDSLEVSKDDHYSSLSNKKKKNLALVEELQKSNKVENLKANPGFGSNIANISNANNTNSSSSNALIEMTDYDAKCKKHGLPVNCYVVGTNILYCSTCKAESNMSVLPLPRIIKDMKKRIDSSRLQLNLIKFEINRLFEFFSSYQEEFERTNKQKIDDLFSYLYKLISYNYNTATQIYKQCKAEQKLHIDQRSSELENLNTELENLSLVIDDIYLSDESEWLKYENNLNEIYDRLNTFLNYETELNLLTMKVGLKNEVKNDIFQIIQDLYYIDIEFANIQGETPTLKHILQKEKFWTCICGELNNPTDTISCLSCTAFRRYETINNFFSSPENVSAEDMKVISNRKKTEARQFQELIKESEKLLKEGANFYAIDIEWFYLWKCYIMNDISEKTLPNSKKKISINSSIGKFSYFYTYNRCLTPWANFQ